MTYGWVQPTLERISDLLRMPDFHNSYGIPRVDPHVAWEAVRLIWPATAHYTPAPRVTPTSAGGLEFLWAGTETECRMVYDPMDGVTLFSGKIGERLEMFDRTESPEKNIQLALLAIHRELTPAGQIP